MENACIDINVLSAWLTPVLGFVTIGAAIFQSYHIARKRKDDLFDKRFDFYKKFEKYRISTYLEINAAPDIIDLIPIASEARFLFGKDIERHVLSLEGKRSTNPMFADEDFSKPFYKYLKL